MTPRLLTPRTPGPFAIQGATIVFRDDAQIATCDLPTCASRNVIADGLETGGELVADERAVYVTQPVTGRLLGIAR